LVAVEQRRDWKTFLHVPKVNGRRKNVSEITRKNWKERNKKRCEKYQRNNFWKGVLRHTYVFSVCVCVCVCGFSYLFFSVWVEYAKALSLSESITTCALGLNFLIKKNQEKCIFGWVPIRRRGAAWMYNNRNILEYNLRIVT
jgi:hypothetical protein